MAEKIERELKWDDPIEHDSSDWMLLPAGEYPFRVTGLERRRFAGSAKLPACNQAVLTLDVGDSEVSTTITHNLYLHTKTEGLLCAFFRSIGARKHGQRVAMDWGKIIGATGRCKVVVHDWTGKDGQTKQGNRVDKFLDPEDPEPQAQAGGAVAQEDGVLPF